MTRVICHHFFTHLPGQLSINNNHNTDNNFITPINSISNSSSSLNSSLKQ